LAKETLKKFGNGRNFIKWIGILYNDAESSIMTNGFQSRNFKVQRSVRQGCPIAPYLYVLQAKPFSISIRKNINTKGVILPKLSETTPQIEAKNNAFAGDTQLFISTAASVTMELYEKASGARANYEKYNGTSTRNLEKQTPYYKTNKVGQQCKGTGIVDGNITGEKY
jgi:hypothetical protein